MKGHLTFFFPLFCLTSVTAQYDPIFPLYVDSTHYKVVIRTEEKVNDRFESRDNLTVRVNGDTSTIFYNDYSDGLISRLMIPYSIFKTLELFEARILSNACNKPDCAYFILFEIGENKLRVPIDILDLEQVSSLMLELEK